MPSKLRFPTHQSKLPRVRGVVDSRAETSMTPANEAFSAMLFQGSNTVTLKGLCLFRNGEKRIQSWRVRCRTSLATLLLLAGTNCFPLPLLYMPTMTTTFEMGLPLNISDSCHVAYIAGLPEPYIRLFHVFWGQNVFGNCAYLFGRCNFVTTQELRSDIKCRN